MDLFTASNVTKQYAAHKALERVSISVQEGTIFGLLGPNGAGKTTLIRIINQIIAPDEGELLFQGRKLLPQDVEKIGYLPEERGLYKKMKVGEQALYLAQLKGLSKSEAEKRLMFWFSNFEIMGWWNRKVEELSKGMQQKVQFIVTIIHQPKLLIFDEPFSGFDPINVNLLKEEILSLKESGSTIIFSTHNMSSVEELCDHIALIDKAKKVLDGNVKEIKRQFATNTFEIRFNTFEVELRTILPASFEILESAIDDELRIARIRLPRAAGPNDLLTQLIPHVTIHSLNEIIPSMNDIFIRVVTEQKPES
ncbi:MAG: ATP-binding cassette domain-containing protein [Bacteroidales bacterium]|nr:ABC transporter ATP-binding protein [Bacteroidota bacterium]MBL6950816.1 ATP-binding cassette domain-containing protein [Bacteroidales bacterium]